MEEKIIKLIKTQEKTNILLKELLIQTVVNNWVKPSDIDGRIIELLDLEVDQEVFKEKCSIHLPGVGITTGVRTRIVFTIKDSERIIKKLSKVYESYI